MAQQAIRKHGPVAVVDVDEIADDELVVPCAMMGAPTVMVEKIPQGDEIVARFRKLERFWARSAPSSAPRRAASTRSCRSSIGAMLGMPVVDGDGMGRAFPEIQMVTPTMYGVSATPMAMADEKGNSVAARMHRQPWTERLARSTTIDMGCSALIALYPMSGAVPKKARCAGR